MKRIVLSFFIIISAVCAFAAGPVDSFVASRAVSSGATAVFVQDLATGDIIASHNPDLPLLPASIMKTVTIASLLSEKGPAERFHTRVYADGDIKDGTLHGSLVVVGGGDPTLGADCLPSSADIAEEIVAALRHRGISRVTDGIRVDTSLYVGPACSPTWAQGDLSESYGTGCHALNFRRNAAGSRAVKNPENVFVNYLSRALASTGITVGGLNSVGSRAGEDALLLVDHLSDTYEEVMRSCMMRSDNLFAESLLRTFALARGAEGSTMAGADEVRKYWTDAGLPMRGVSIVDGSGLSRSNRVTAKFMAGVLRYMKDNVEYASFMPLAGQEGTLSDFLKDTPLEAYVAMKTGSMKGIQCYAGYKLDEDFAPTHSIVIIMNDIGTRSQARSAAESLLLRLFPNP